MAKSEKKHIFVDMIKEGLSYISQIVSASIFPSITEGTEMVMRNIEDKMIQIEKRIMRNISYLLIISFGGILLIFSLFFFLKEHLGWNNVAAFFSIGIIILVMGLLLKLGETNR